MHTPIESCPTASRLRVIATRCLAVLFTACLGLSGLAQNAAPSSHMNGDDNFPGDIIINEVRVPAAELNLLYTTIYINGVPQFEGNSGTYSNTFYVSLSVPSAVPVTVNYATADGTATAANGDYQPWSGTLTFDPGQTSQTIYVLVNGDITVEPDETFTVNLSAPRPMPCSRMPRVSARS